MRFDSVFLAGRGTWLAPRVTLDEACGQGLGRPEELAATGLHSVAVSDGTPAPEMAARAVRRALAHSGLSSHEIDLVLYANVFYQGHDMWAPASYVQREGLGNCCTTLEIRQMSNGGMAALSLAAVWLTAAPTRASAAVVAADRFCLPGIDRWRSDPGTVFGDGAAAMVLDNRAGFARLVSLATVSDPEMEQMHRGDDPFGDAPYRVRIPLDCKVNQRDYLRRAGLAATVVRTNAGQRDSLKQALAEAETEMAQIDWFVLPHFGRRRLQANYYTKLNIPEERTAWSLARTVGHLGAGDQLAGLSHLLDSDRARPGDRCLLMGVGAGFTWSTAVVEILRPTDGRTSL